MDKTTFMKKRKDMPRQPLKNCHGGNGALDWTVVLNGAELKGRGLNFVHDDILPSGASIGTHKHSADEEYYYIVSGKGIMTLDQERIAVSAGDMTAVFPGGMHGLKNTGDQDLRIIVIGVNIKPNKAGPRDAK